ncbi:ABC transporter permease [Conexibacter sp. JD483]|uniref:ABC transporter permease n=1 Tax=unclassified Conexibacter TaxID=2627773 RepID=UPI002715CDA2|nr:MULTISPECIES: ABC transporter permease [unclassified Conexibacter]MDO8186840.1 ABC transporter permease [Conexibacter sp. CPCC 205706]MDO8197406.1 ABC transporter permease [Conexibacter sp. CPCC 205762]MDR9372707.1 ABC transporter permease [Conexibacter sp. JD483]
MSAVATPPSPDSGAQRARWLISDSLTLARRNLAHVRQIPEKLLDVTLQPVMFVLLFAFVFGGVIGIPGGGSYREYLVGGILVQSLAFGMMGPGTAIATDLGEGFVDRVRSLPTSRTAYLGGHMVAEFAAMTLAITILSITGVVVGWRIHGGFLDALAGYGLLFLFGIAMLWLGTFVGTVARSPDAVAGIAFMGIFPLTFISSVFVPIGGLPDGLRQVAEWNPVSAMAVAARTLFGNPTGLPDDPAWPLAHPVLAATIWCLVILAVTIPLTVRRFLARTSG